MGGRADVVCGRVGCSTNVVGRLPGTGVAHPDSAELASGCDDRVDIRPQRGGQAHLHAIPAQGDQAVANFAHILYSGGPRADPVASGGIQQREVR